MEHDHSIEGINENEPNTSLTDAELNPRRMLSFHSPDEKNAREIQNAVRLSHAAIDSAKGGVSIAQKQSSKDLTDARVPLKVYLRIRPFTSAENHRGEVNCIRVLGTSAVAIHAPKDSHTVKTKGETEGRFMFTHVFGPECNQEDVYQECASSLTDGLTQGHNSLLFTYGVTNAGKTFTIQGNKDHPGIIPRVFINLLKTIRPLSLKDPTINRPFPPQIVQDFFIKSSVRDDSNVDFLLQGTTAASRSNFIVTVSYLEIYNEQVFDLLNESGSDKRDLPVRENKGRVVIPDLKEVPIQNLAEAMEVLRRGQANRQKAETLVNHDSSRSHSVFTLKLYSLGKLGKITDQRCARFSIVDLAGSERLVRTQNTGIRLKEAANINNSLGVLARCMEAMRSNQHQSSAAKQMCVPFRESKLTRIFQDFFTGCGRMVMIINVSSTGSDFDETLHVLKFSAIAKEVTLTTRLDTGAKGLKKGNQDASAQQNGPMKQSQNEIDLMEENARLQVVNDELALQVERYQEQLVEIEMRCHEIEADVRFEVSNELAERLNEMEYMCKARIEREVVFAEEAFEKKLEVIQKAALVKPIGRLPKSVSSLRRLYRKVAERNRVLEEINEQLATDLKGKTSMIQFKQIEIDQLKKAAMETASNRAGLVTKLSKLQYEMDAQTVDKVMGSPSVREMHDRQIKSMLSEIERVKKEYADEKVHLQLQLEDMKARLDAALVEVVRSSDLAASQSRQIESMKSDMMSLMEEKIILQSRIQQLQSDGFSTDVTENADSNVDAEPFIDLQSPMVFSNIPLIVETNPKTLATLEQASSNPAEMDVPQEARIKPTEQIMRSAKKLKRKASTEDSIDLSIENIAPAPPVKRPSFIPLQENRVNLAQINQRKSISRRTTLECGNRKSQPLVYEDAIHEEEKPISTMKVVVRPIINRIIAKLTPTKEPVTVTVLSPKMKSPRVDEQPVSNPATLEKENQSTARKQPKKKLFSKKPKAVQEVIGDVEPLADLDPASARRARYRMGVA